MILVKNLKIPENFQSKKRGIWDIIVSLLLVSITVIAGILMFGIFTDSGVTGDVTTEIAEPISFQGGIKLTAYDTRDGANLMGITTIDNNISGNFGELDAGIEYIVLKIVNNTPNETFLQGISVNQVSHVLDSDGALPPGFGQFSIIPGTDDEGTTPQTTSEIKEGKTVRLVIGLSSSITPDIDINSPIRVSIDAQGFDIQNFIITAGNTR